VHLLDAERVEQCLLHVDEVAEGDDREAHAVRLARVRIDRGRPSRGRVRVLGVDVDQVVGADDEELVRVDRLAGADDRLPIAGCGIALLVLAGGVRIAGEEMRDDDDVVARGVELAVALPADFHVLDRLVSDGGVARHREDLLLDDADPALGQGGRSEGNEGGKQERAQQAQHEGVSPCG
jgi:hypothetical protein